MKFSNCRVKGASSSWIILLLWLHFYCWDDYEERNECYLFISPQSSLALDPYYQYFMLLSCAHHTCQIHWDTLQTLTCHCVSIFLFCLNLDEASYPIKFIVACLLGVICVDCLVSYNNTNWSFVEICKWLFIVFPLLTGYIWYRLWYLIWYL